MLWSILLGLALIAYSVYELIRHLQKMARGDCSACPFSSGCDGHCRKK